MRNVRRLSPVSVNVCRPFRRAERFFIGALNAQHRFARRSCPQHIHRVPTGPILGMHERPHGLAAQAFTEAKFRWRDWLVTYRSDGSGAPPTEMRPVVFGACGFFLAAMKGTRAGTARCDPGRISDGAERESVAGFEL